MKINKDETQNIANLARLELTEEELKTYGAQMSQVFDYMEELREVEVEGVKPTAQVTGVENVIRSDVSHNWDPEEIKASLKQAPARDGDYIKVKKVL